MLSLPERLARRVLNAVPTRVGDIHVLEGAGAGGLPPNVVLHGSPPTPCVTAGY